MRLLVCGGRYFNDRDLLESILDGLCDEEMAMPRILLHGDGIGADTLADRWAHKRCVEVWRFPAGWERHGKAAGPIRNQAMIDSGKPDLVIAFPGGRGTADMIRRARKAGIEVREVGTK